MANTQKQNNTVQIELSKIDASNKKFQVRDAENLDKNNLESLIFSDPTQWQPVVLTQSIDGYIIVSGFHRIEALHQINKLAEDSQNHMSQVTTVKAIVLDNGMSETDMMLAAFKYNSEHGLHLTTAEKKHYAVELYKVNPSMAHYQIAKQVHLSDKTVTSAINAYLTEQNKPAKTEETEETTEETEETTEETEENIDFVSAYNTFAKSLRKFYNIATELETSDEMASFLARSMTKQAKTNKQGEIEQDSDLDILKVYAEMFTKAVAILSPKNVKRTKK